MYRGVASRRSEVDPRLPPPAMFPFVGRDWPPSIPPSDPALEKEGRWRGRVQSVARRRAESARPNWRGDPKGVRKGAENFEKNIRITPADRLDPTLPNEGISEAGESAYPTVGRVVRTSGPYFPAAWG